MKPFVTQVWPQFTADQQFCAAFGSVLVDRVELYRTKRQVVICLRSAEPLDQALCGRLCASLSEVFAGYELQIRSYFAYQSITPESVRLMLEELKQRGMPVNGFLDKAQPVTFGEDGITIHVNAGRQILESVELPRVLAELIQERTGALPIVRLADTGNTRTEEEFEQYLQEKAPVVKFEAKETPPDFTIEGLALTNKPVKLFYGKQFKPTDTRRLNDLGDGGKVTVWGDVFATEVKGSRRKIYFTSITDYSGSVNLKVMGEEGADMSKWEGLKPGTTLIVRGNYMYDKYEHDFVIMPYDVLQVEREQRQDTAPDGEKRVELHLHTKSSSMDGFNDPGKIVRLAHRMGHRAVAITDLGPECADGTAEKVAEVEAALKDGSLHVFDTSKFTVGGETVTTAPVDLTYYDYSTGSPVAVYQGETKEAISDGYFHEGELRAAPTFSLRIDGIIEDADPVA